MSVVTNVILTTPSYDSVELEYITKQINSFFEEGRGLVNCDDKKLPRGWYGGTKMLECEVFIGSFNYLNFLDLVKHLKSVDWLDTYGDSIQLMIKEQEDTSFRVITIIKPRKDI